MEDIMSTKDSKITDVKGTKSSNEKKEAFECLQVTLDDGRKVGFSSTDAEQDYSTSCHRHIRSVDYAMK